MYRFFFILTGKVGYGLVNLSSSLAVGFNDAAKRFIVRNSWGRGWGLKGYFTMPYQYLLDENLSDDFWTIRVVEENKTGKKR